MGQLHYQTRRFTVNRKRVAITLDSCFWQALDNMAKTHKTFTATLVQTACDTYAANTNIPTRVRVFLLNHLMAEV